MYLIFSMTLFIFIDFEPLHQDIQPIGEFGKSLGACLHLQRHIPDLPGLTAYQGDVTGDVGHHHRALGYVFIDLGDPL